MKSYASSTLLALGEATRSRRHRPHRLLAQLFDCKVRAHDRYPRTALLLAPKVLDDQVNEERDVSRGCAGEEPIVEDERKRGQNVVGLSFAEP